MLESILKQKRELMGWTGITAIVVCLFSDAFYPGADVNLRFFLLASGLGLVCLALPKSIWPNFGSWWTSD